MCSHVDRHRGTVPFLRCEDEGLSDGGRVERLNVARHQEMYRDEYQDLARHRITRHPQSETRHLGVYRLQSTEVTAFRIGSPTSRRAARCLQTPPPTLPPRLQAASRLTFAQPLHQLLDVNPLGFAYRAPFGAAMRAVLLQYPYLSATALTLQNESVSMSIVQNFRRGSYTTPYENGLPFLCRGAVPYPTGEMCTFENWSAEILVACGLAIVGGQCTVG